MIFVTKKDCELLYEEFKEYYDKADQAEFILLKFLDDKIKYTIENYDKLSQDDLKDMFVCIYKVIGDETKENKYREIQ